MRRKPLRVLSLGAGVQSTTLALLAARGEIAAPEAAIFADTGWEPKAVYAHLAWLRSGVLPFPVHIVSVGNIRENFLRRRNTSGGRFVAAPFYIRNPDGSEGIGRRQCTREYKIEPIQKKIRSMMGAVRQMIQPDMVSLMIGISLDEAHRAKDSAERYIRNIYPLLDLGMTRSDCQAWLTRNGYPIPPKSACIGCPYTSDRRWIERRYQQPDEWAEAVAVDHALRNGAARGMNGAEYIHNSRVPLDQVDFSRIDPTRQPDLFGNECEGMCGV